MPAVRCTTCSGSSRRFVVSKAVVSEEGAAVIITVTLNAALDRSLSVPIFKLGHRHRSSDVLVLAGGKGINVARALKRLDVPVVATGLAGGRTGTRIVEELTEEAILNDFVRIRDESRTSTAVVDPTAGTYTEINEWGPKVSEDELEILLDKLRYLSRGASTVVFAGSLPRGVDESFYADAVREMTRLGARVVLDAEGEPLRRGIEAEPWLVSPNQHEAEQLVGQELEDDDDFAMALDTIAEMGARNVQITMETGCFSLVREERQVRRYRAKAPQLEPVSVLGAGDVFLARWLAAQDEGLPTEESLRLAVAAASASVLEVGAGRFDPKEAARLASLVEVNELQPVA
jgi:1-phosphofructokinase family hexose kinase